LCPVKVAASAGGFKSEEIVEDMPSVKLNGVDLYYETCGAGEAVILLGGLGMTCEGWISQVQFLCRYFQVVSLDNRGSGRTDFPGTDISIADMANDVLGLMDFLAVEKAHFIGLSLGGFIALEFVRRYPGRVMSLILSNAAPRLDARSKYRLKLWEEMKRRGIDLSIQIREQLLWIFPEDFFASEKLPAIMLKNMMDFSFRQSDVGYAGQVNACISFDATDYLAEIKIPVLVFASDDDLIIPMKMSRKLVSGIPGTRLIVMEGCGHLIPALKPGKFNRIALDFVKASSTEPPSGGNFYTGDKR